MPRLQWALLCQRVITDADTNLVSYIDVLEAMHIPQVPIAAPPTFVTALWRRSSPDEKLRTRIRLLSPNKTELVSFEVPEITLSRLRHRVNVQVGGYPVTELGQYEFLVEHFDEGKWKTEASLPLDVNLATPSATH